jgi:nicotinamidase-related amidase
MSKSKDLHGNAPDKSNVALLLIDIISDFEFIDGEKLFKNTLPIAKNIASLKNKAKKAGVPVVYVNDNFGKWQSDFKKLLEHCLDKSVRGSQIVEMLAPDDEEDYFVLKPKNSGFYSTTLELLLQHLNCKTLILTGVATDICILFTANDAYLRDFNLIIPSDCVAANEKKDSERTLKYLEKILKADIRPSDKINFNKLKRG